MDDLSTSLIGWLVNLLMYLFINELIKNLMGQLRYYLKNAELTNRLFEPLVNEFMTLDIVKLS